MSNEVQNPDNYTIVAVEEDSFISDALKNMIHSTKYSLSKFVTFEEALPYIKKENPDILIIDFSTVTDTKLALLKELRNYDLDLYIILLINSMNLPIPVKELKKLSVQGYCEKDDKLGQLPLFIEAAVKSINQLKTIKSMNYKLLQSKNQLTKAYLESVETLRYTVEAKDTYTKGHSDRVSAYSVLIGKSLGLPQSDIETLRIGGLFHDVGKIGISDSILLKNGKLTDEEYSEIKRHPIIGKNILSNAEIFEDIIPIVLYHHERYDGKGYPYGLSDKDIPFLARIVAVADAFDAMTSKRSYRDELDLEFVKDELRNKTGTQFDPIVTASFLNILNNEYRLIRDIKFSH